MNQLRALRVLVKVRVRRGVALEEAVALAQRTHAAAQASEDQAREAVDAALANEGAARHKLAQMLDAGQTFNVTSMEARQNQIDIMVGLTVTARADVERCSADVANCAQQLRDRRADVARNKQKIQAMQNDIKRLLEERQQAEDDQQDEEAEEAAIGRMVAANRQGAEQAMP